MPESQSFYPEIIPKAVQWLRKAWQANPRFAATLRMLAASLAMHNKEDEARSVGHALLRLDKNFSVDRFISWYPLVRKADSDNLRQGLIASGLPQ